MPFHGHSPHEIVSPCLCYPLYYVTTSPTSPSFIITNKPPINRRCGGLLCRGYRLTNQRTVLLRHARSDPTRHVAYRHHVPLQSKPNAYTLYICMLFLSPWSVNEYSVDIDPLSRDASDVFVYFSKFFLSCIVVVDRRAKGSPHFFKIIVIRIEMPRERLHLLANLFC